MEKSKVKKALSLFKRHYRKSFGVPPREEDIRQHQIMLEQMED